MRVLAMAFHVYLPHMDMGNVIIMSGTSLTIYAKAFRHPTYQMPASFRGTGRSLASDQYGHGKYHCDVGNIIDHAITTFMNPFTSDPHRKR
jgi:hypothetical protein